MDPEKECGNGALLDHGEGWTTQHRHLAKGSLKVSEGDLVDRGASLGLTGFSGLTAFSHVHFTVLRNGHVIGPFDAQPMSQGCVVAGDDGLWREKPQLRFGGLVEYGPTGERPRLEDMRKGCRNRRSTFWTAF